MRPASSCRRLLASAFLALLVLLLVVNLRRAQLLLFAHHRYPPPRSGFPQHHVRQPATLTASLASEAGDAQPLLVDTPGCRIPDLEALSPEVAEFIADYEMGACDDDRPPLVRSTDSALYVDVEALANYGVQSPDELSCCYTAMWRGKPNVTLDVDEDEGEGLGRKSPRPQGTRTGPLYDKVEYDNDIRFASHCVPFFWRTEVPHEFVRVRCKVAVGAAGGHNASYTDYHAFVPLKEPRARGSKAKAAKAAKALTSEDSLSVLIVGADSVSRLNMIRHMPRTRDYLQRNLGAVEMLGYNKVEDNTFPNLVPLLSGLSVPELRAECWNDGERGNSAHFDACPWVWRRFSREGYVNMFAEDSAWMGLFQYFRKGFVEQPTEYDARPLLYLGEKELGRRLRAGGPRLCIGPRTQLDVLADYSAKFVRAMRRHDRKFFGVAWGSSLTHDDLNAAGAADEPYERLLRALHDTGVLNHTALVFMSDHGLRFGDILTTRQGRLEERLPSMYLALPDWVRRRYPRAVANLRANQRRLVTVFDLHETLFNFMDLSSLGETELRLASGRQRAQRGLSVFTPIPEERTCANAGIPWHYCACQDLVPVPTDGHRVTQVAEFLISEVNDQLQRYPQCARLQLDGVLDASRAEHTEKALEQFFELTVRAWPGGAMLGAMVRYRVGTGTMHLEGSVSRLNRYDNQSSCVHDFKMRLLCYCSDT